MTRPRYIQIAAIILALAAGFLWSRRLYADTYNQSISAIETSNTEQIEILKEKVAEKTDPFELVNFGRKLLDAGSPHSAVVALLKATELQPNFPDGWYLLGYSYVQIANTITDARRANEKQEYLNKATDALTEARRLNPTHQPTNDLLKQLGR